MLLPYHSRRVYSVKMQEASEERYVCFTSESKALMAFEAWCLAHPKADVWVYKGHKLLNLRRVSRCLTA